MKKFNPEKEISKMNKTKKGNNSSKLSNLFVPILVVACSCMAMTAVAFSAFLEEGEKDSYIVHIDIINGDEESYEKIVHEGGFSDTITSKNSFGSIECTSGKLTYDPITQTVSTPYLNRNTTCIISFMNDAAKNIDPTGLTKISDNRGISYYYKADAENNYVLLNDMMFRIVRVNGDGSLRLMYNDIINISEYGYNNKYADSYVKSALEDFVRNNFYSASYLATCDFDVTNYVTIDTEDLINLEGYYISNVGLLSVREAEVITKDTSSSYLNTISGIFLTNGNEFDNVYAYRNNTIESVHYSTQLGIKPVICINAKLIGSGTKNNPYTIANE